MKKRKKKYCQLKHTQKMNEAMLNNKVVFYMKNSHAKQPIKFLNTNWQELPVNSKVANAIEYYRYNWSVTIVVFGFESNGKQRLESRVISINMPLYQKDLIEFLNEQHQEFIQEFREHNEPIGAGWMASAVGRDFTEEQIYNCFTKNGAWENENT